jgi:hypothetical protein
MPKEAMNRIGVSVFVVCLAAGTLWLASTAPAEAQTAAAVSAMLPDVVGFRTGVPIQQAFPQLKAHNAKAKIQFDNVTIPGISEKPIPYQLTLSEFGTDTSPEAIQFGVTLPPSPQAVWKVGRQLLALSSDQDMSRTQLIKALREKYGQEDYMNSAAAMNDMVWLFDEHGQRATENRPPASPCALAPVVSNTNGLGMAVLNQPSPTFPQDHTGGWLRCKSMIFVKAFMQTAPAKGSEFIRSFTVTVGDSGLASRAADATVGFLANASGQQRKQELDKVTQQAPPKL